jgi:hypothetical protein
MYRFDHWPVLVLDMYFAVNVLVPGVRPAMMTVAQPALDAPLEVSKESGSLAAIAVAPEKLKPIPMVLPSVPDEVSACT